MSRRVSRGRIVGSACGFFRTFFSREEGDRHADALHERVRELKAGAAKRGLTSGASCLAGVLRPACTRARGGSEAGAQVCRNVGWVTRGSGERAAVL